MQCTEEKFFDDLPELAFPIVPVSALPLNCERDGSAVRGGGAHLPPPDLAPNKEHYGVSLVLTPLCARNATQRSGFVMPYEAADAGASCRRADFVLSMAVFEMTPHVRDLVRNALHFWPAQRSAIVLHFNSAAYVRELPTARNVAQSRVGAESPQGVDEARRIWRWLLELERKKYVFINRAIRLPVRRAVSSILVMNNFAFFFIFIFLFIFFLHSGHICQIFITCDMFWGGAMNLHLFYKPPM